ncbi:hypothetical protein MKW94_003599 [Papaver nudicaule]|uniref:UAS domain-containing protein n=1 Tax=Papaver nudicaule TaxID=74823 RepID=A0AA41V2U2_PAPNU|nr:hypothetical protein [Papaver nudicaule]
MKSNSSHTVQLPAATPVKRDTLDNYYDPTIVKNFTPVRRDNLCNYNDPTTVKNFNQKMQHAGIWDSEKKSATQEKANSRDSLASIYRPMQHAGTRDSDKSATQAKANSRDNLASIYRPPFNLMYDGSFHETKQVAKRRDKWIIVNLQSRMEFDSHVLNRDTWSNEVVADIISVNFIFWQAYNDTFEGQKVCDYYNLVYFPVVLVVDPITEQKVQTWSGMIQAERLLEELIPFMDAGPKNHHVERPGKCQKQLLQSNFLQTDPIQMIWRHLSRSQLDEVHLTLAIPSLDGKEASCKRRNLYLFQNEG